MSSMTEILTPLGKVFNTAYTSPDDIFAADLDPASKPTLVRIDICCSVSAVLTAILTDAGVDVDCELNSGVALVADCLYQFEMLVGVDQTINFKYGINCLILQCVVVG